MMSMSHAISAGNSIEENSDLFKELSLNSAIELAQKNDLWLTANYQQQKSIDTMSIAANTFPDATVSLNFANLPTDTFQFGKDPMSQFKVGVSQAIPRGDSLKIRQEQLQLESSQYPYLRLDRMAKIKVIASELWFDAYKAQQSIALIAENYALFEQLTDVAQARYSTAVGKTRQQDIIHAQLEVTRLEDRLAILNQQLSTSKSQLLQWISQYYLNQQAESLQSLTSTTMTELLIAKNLPEQILLNEELYQSNNTQQALLLTLLNQHPALLALTQKIKTTSKGIELAKQKFKPQWAVNASYGVRNSTTNIERPDLFSVGVSFDLPFFTENKQDNELKSAQSKTASVKSSKWLLLRQLFTNFEASKSLLMRTQAREQLYQEKLLPQIYQQAEATLNAYTSDDGDFAEVARSRIAVLNAEIDMLGIRVDKQKAITKLNYFSASSTGNNIVIGEAQ